MKSVFFFPLMIFLSTSLSCNRETPALDEFEVEVIGYINELPLILFNAEDIAKLSRITGLESQKVFIANNLDNQLQRDGLNLNVMVRKPTSDETRSMSLSLPELVVIRANRR